MADSTDFQRELGALLNRYSIEHASNTPDFILAQFLRAQLTAFAEATESRDKWYGIEPVPGTDWRERALQKHKEGCEEEDGPERRRAVE